jgi:predicted P-loop ATPase
MIGRVKDPGIKFDHVLILEGPQGCGKSTAVRILAGNDWHTDAPIIFSDKDSVLTMRSKWVIELGELSGMGKADVETLKAFVTRQTDRIRAPYARKPENFARQCIFIGTTNDDEYLRDNTGGRRFWPVSVDQCKFDDLARDRDQLLAEAVESYDLGETLYINEHEVVEQATGEQKSRTWRDELTNVLGDFLLNSEVPIDSGFAISDVFAALDKQTDFGDPILRMLKADKSGQMRVTSALKLLGYIRVRSGKERKRVWVRG